MNKKILFFFACVILCYGLLQINGQAEENDASNTAHPLAEATLVDQAQTAASLCNAGRFNQAMQLYRSMARAGNRKALVNWAVLLKDLGYYDQAGVLLRRALTQKKDDIDSLLLLGRLYYLNNTIDKAIPILNQVVALQPNHVGALLMLGLCFQEKKNDDEALGYFKQVIALDEKSVLGYLSLADLYYQKQRLPEALEAYKRVSMLDTSMVRMFFVLGELLFRLGNLEESLKMYRKIRAIDPGNTTAQARINEITKTLGEEFFAKERFAESVRRKQKEILVTPLPAIKHMVMVRVGIVRQEPWFEFFCSSDFEIKVKGENKILAWGAKGKQYKVSRLFDNTFSFIDENNETTIIDQPFSITLLEPDGTLTICNLKFGNGNYWSGHQDRSFRGSFEVDFEKDQGLKVVNVVTLEEYLYGVVPAEMPAKWPKEALKAQAVAARSEVMAKLGRHKQEGFDFCPEVHCQAYAGVERETAATNAAVDETRGLVMAYQGKPIDAIYSSNCGGHTQNNIFGDGRDIAYLKARPDVLNDKEVRFPLSPVELERWIDDPSSRILCNISENAILSNFRWVRTYSAEELQTMMNKVADIGAIKKIIVLKRNVSGHISALKVIGNNGDYVLEKELRIRTVLGNLRSSMFKVEIKFGPDKQPEKFIFFGGGWGHGVGMCQSGAFGLASQGKNFKEILQHYFPATEFKSVY
ncbi:MAG: SpoIID/LytB domain-containing protein [Candidatus Omnitrophica bacterium]|nr:SpoIID/LytB domain-containing protein [Candidatus Omnitrophota bacterium]